MKLWMDRKKQAQGLPYRKEAKVLDPLSPYKRMLPDSNYPTARLNRIRKKSKHFIANRQGWKRFYREQDWFGRRLNLQSKLCK